MEPKTVEKKFLLSNRDILGNVALWAVKQSPYHRPDNLEVVLDKLNATLPTSKGYFHEMIYLEIFNFIKSHLWAIPEFMAWNERKNGNQAPYGFVDRYSQPSPDNDFIDLDALIRNVSNSIIREAFQKPIPEILAQPLIAESLKEKE